jgi:hypothetical protein
VEEIAVGDQLGDLDLKGFSRPVRAYDIRGLDEARLP